MSRELDDDDRANLSHLMRLAEVLNHSTPQSIIDWNEALNQVPVKPTSKRKKRKKRSK
jgi:hypothetical protein